jgi:hypothetical protein
VIHGAAIRLLIKLHLSKFFKLGCTHQSNNPLQKFIGINLMKEVKDFYNENYKTLMKEIEEDTK